MVNALELRGTENYYEWRRQTERLLLGEGVYRHVSRGTNPFNYDEYASTMPEAVNPLNPTSEEKEQIEAWLKDDRKAKSIIMRKLNSMVLALIPNDISIRARDVWGILASHYDRADVSLQFSLRDKLASLQMKGASGAEEYVAAHVHANEKLAWMGTRPTETDAIYALLRGLPQNGLWPMIRKAIEVEVERSNEAFLHQAQQLLPQQTGPFSSLLSQPTSSPSAPQQPAVPCPFALTAPQSTNPFVLRLATFPPSHPLTGWPVFTPRAYTFHNAAQTILKEAIQMLSESPGSEFVPAAISGGLGSMNPATGLRRTKNNPTGTPCSNSICVTRGSQDGHNHDNCFQNGGGKAGQAPWQRKKKSQSGDDTPVAKRGRCGYV